jgi:hypothetical protein
MENEMSKESLLKLLLEDTPVDELREVIMEIVKRDETLRQAIVMGKANETVVEVEKLEAKKRRRKARS